MSWVSGLLKLGWIETYKPWLSVCDILFICCYMFLSLENVVIIGCIPWTVIQPQTTYPQSLQSVLWLYQFRENTLFYDTTYTTLCLMWNWKQMRHIYHLSFQPITFEFETILYILYKDRKYPIHCDIPNTPQGFYLYIDLIPLYFIHIIYLLIQI